MADKAESQSSLFAGMNMGEIRQSRTSTSSSHHVKMDTKFAEGRNIKDSKDKIISMNSPGVTGRSSFSFIRQSEAVEPASDPVVDLGCKVAGDKEKSKTTQLDPFEILDESDSVTGDENKLLSYTDQLAEILPMGTPVDETLVTLSDSHSVIEDDRVELSLQDHSTHLGIGLLNQDAMQEEKEENIILNSSIKKDEDEVTESPDINAVQDTQYNLVLEPEDKFSLFLSQHSFKLTQLRNEKDELQENLCLVYEDVKNKIGLLRENLNSLKIEFDEALHNDDYDLAAEINEKIEQLTIEKCEIQRARPGLLNSKAKEYLTRAAVFVEKERSFHQWALTKYRDLEQEQGKMLTQHRDKCTKEIDTKKQLLKCQKDEINRSLEHLQLDKEHNEKDRHELNSQIDAKLQVLLKKKKELVGKKGCLQQKIEELERRLNELKTESEGVESAIRIEEEKMKEARKEFEPLETKVKDKSHKIRNEEETLKVQMEQVELQERDLDLIAKQNKEIEESLERNICYLNTNKMESETLIQLSQEEADEKLLDIFVLEQSEEENNRLKNLRIREKVKTADLQELELQVFNKEQKIMMKKKRLQEIATQVPEFDKAKKTAVTDHNFKEAKRLNEIIKQLSSEVETTRTDVQEMEDTLTIDREKVAEMKDELEKLKRDVLVAKESHDLDVFKRIVNKITMLVEERTRIRKDSLVETLREAELDLLKTEFSFVDISSESVVSKMTDADQQKVVFVREFLGQEKRMENAFGD